MHADRLPRIPRDARTRTQMLAVPFAASHSSISKCQRLARIRGESHILTMRLRLEKSNHSVQTARAAELLDRCGRRRFAPSAW